MLIKGSEAGKLAGKEGGGRRQALTPVPKHVNLCVWRGITLSPPLPHKWKMIHVAANQSGHPMPIPSNQRFLLHCNIAHL